jgi:hypothetical protein
VLAKQEDILWKYGGRPDDVTVVVAIVSDSPPSATTSIASLSAPRLTVTASAAPEDVLGDVREGLLRSDSLSHS